MSDDCNLQGGGFVGGAVKRDVTFQITYVILGGIIFLMIMYYVILSHLNHTAQTAAMSQGTLDGTTITINGHPATDVERRMFEQSITSGSK